MTDWKGEIVSVTANAFTCSFVLLLETQSRYIHFLLLLPLCGAGGGSSRRVQQQQEPQKNIIILPITRDCDYCPCSYSTASVCVRALDLAQDILTKEFRHKLIRNRLYSVFLPPPPSIDLLRSFIAVVNLCVG